MSELVVRPLEIDDKPVWNELWQGYLTFYEARVEDVVTETTWLRLLNPGDGPYGLVAVNKNGRICGIVHYLFHVSTWTVDPYCYLQDLFVDPDVRGKGAGRALIEAVYDAAHKYGASQVYWLTQDFNHTARRLYDDIGTVTPFIKYRGF